MDLVLQKIKNETESSADVRRKSPSPRQQHSPVDSSPSSGGCSRRAILKQRKFCHQCKRRPASIVENCADSSGPMRFCSSSCLDTYKLDVFTRETLLCLQNGPAGSGSGHSAVGALSTSPSGRMMGAGSGGKQRGGRMGERVVASPTKTRKRGHHPRPHPSYRLNKRYWDDLRAGRIAESDVLAEVPKKRKSEERQLGTVTLTAQESAPPATVIQIAAGTPPFVLPISAPRPAEPRTTPFQPAAVVQPVAAPTVSVASPVVSVHHHHHEQQQQQQLNKSSSLFTGLIIIPIPIPIPFPMPLPLTEKFILDKYGRV